MIKLKNLWKIALATMAMSAMLVACDTKTKDDDNDGDSATSLGGEGVYSYTVNIADISTAWGGTSKSPTFSILLMKDAQLEACKTAKDFKQATAADPEYQIAAFDNMKIKDTSSDGNFVVYGAIAVEDVYQYYTGVVATVTATDVTVTVDMSKLVKTELKALFAANAEGVDEAVMTDDDIVELNGYKPYIIALGQQTIDADNYVMSGWNADLMKMTAGATLPSNAKKDAPVVPTCKNLNSVAGSMNGWTHTAITDNAFDFEAAGNDQFAFTNGSWDFKACGVVVEALGTEYQLKEGDNANITFADGVLTAGTTYTATLIVKGNHEAYVKVTAK